MKKCIRLVLLSILIGLMLLFLTSCNRANKEENGDGSNGENGEENNTYDVDAKGIPRFVYADYIELAKIYRISKFRSGVGHSYSDDFESCRSMKHYFQPKTSIDWSKVKIYSPVDGTVISVNEDEDGAQVRIKSKEYPAFFFIIFHVNLANPLSVDDEVTEGQMLGTHIGVQTMSDIAVGVNTPTGWKLVSYFKAMADVVFQGYQARGLNSRNAAIISEQARDADPLTCNGENFVNSGNLVNWVILTTSPVKGTQ